MAPPSTLFRFRLSLENSAQPIDFRVAMHPSETQVFLVARVLAYALNYQDGIEFTAGLADPDVPAIRITGNYGENLKWIDIGNPSPRRLHKAAKASASVSVYTHKDVEQLKRDVMGETIYNAHKIQVFAFDPEFLELLSETLERDNHWMVVLNQNQLEVTVGDELHESVLVRHELKTKK